MVQVLSEKQSLKILGVPDNIIEKHSQGFRETVLFLGFAHSRSFREFIINDIKRKNKI